MTTSAPSGSRRKGLGVAWLLTSGFVAACSLLAPSDPHYLGGPEGARGPTGESGQAGSDAGAGGQAGWIAGNSGQAGSDAGAGGQPALGGVGGLAEGGQPSGGEAATSCADNLADCNHDAKDGCEVNLSSSDANCGGCGKAFACAADETCLQQKCVSQSGCSDGTREAFLPTSQWPRLAGCTASWPRSSLRQAKTGSACGFEQGPCEVPADACGNGWHVCAIPPFGAAEVRSQATAEECAAQPGAYVAGVGDQSCEPCSEAGDGAACCGDLCVQQNGGCIYPGKTAWFGVYQGYVNLCSAIETNLPQRGVLCCRTP